MLKSIIYFKTFFYILFRYRSMMEKFEKSIDEAKKKRKNCVDEPQSIIAHKMYTDDEISYNQKKKWTHQGLTFR